MKIILKKDLVIPEGTIFDDCDGLRVDFASGNFVAIQGTGKDGVIAIYIDDVTTKDKPDQFKFID